jgi:hypothetical protein
MPVSDATDAAAAAARAGSLSELPSPRARAGPTPAEVSKLSGGGHSGGHDGPVSLTVAPGPTPGLESLAGRCHWHAAVTFGPSP